MCKCDECVWGSKGHAIMYLYWESANQNYIFTEMIDDYIFICIVIEIFIFQTIILMDSNFVMHNFF